MNLLHWFCDLFRFKREEEEAVQPEPPVDFYYMYNPWDDFGEEYRGDDM